VSAIFALLWPAFWQHLGSLKDPVYISSLRLQGVGAMHGNPKSQITNIKQITMTKIKNPKPFV
jgi:hypothetical protein